MKSIHCYAPAKINLTLDVKLKKPGADFHEIETIYHRIRLVDEITIIESDKFEIIGDFDCPPEENLISKAFALIRSFHPKAPNVKVEVIKNIPARGGLGGGSSNFATFIKLYFKLFELGAIPQELIQKAGDIGKDIPFFFQEAPCALGTHFGEIITPLATPLSGVPIYLYVPPFGYHTTESYKALKTFDTNFTEAFLQHLSSNPTTALNNRNSFLMKHCGNTFDQLMKTSIDGAHLTGSGSVFYSFKDLGEIQDGQRIKTELL